jgi:hypothetical protein
MDSVVLAPLVVLGVALVSLVMVIRRVRRASTGLEQAVDDLSRRSPSVD